MKIILNSKWILKLQVLLWRYVESRYRDQPRNHQAHELWVMNLISEFCDGVHSFYSKMWSARFFSHHSIVKSGFKLFLWTCLCLWDVVGKSPSDEGNACPWNYSVSENGSTLLVSNKDLKVEFSSSVAWTMTEMSYRKQSVVSHTGFNGCVVNVTPAPGEENKPDATWIGTGHGREVVKNIKWMTPSGEGSLTPSFTSSSLELTLRKESSLGPLDHVAEMIFPKAGDRFLEKHQFKVVEDLNLRFNYVYAFMHCNLNTFRQWMAELDDGSFLEGECSNDDNRFMLHKNIRSLVFYSQQDRCGVAYVYPEVYPGSDTFKNAIWDRPIDNKFYFRPDVKKNLKLGDQWEYVLTVIPFSSAPESWKETGRSLMKP